MKALDSIREYCLSLPATTEKIQWEDVLLFRVGGKIFVMVNLDPAAEDRIAFKCDPDTFAELLEPEGARPAAYVGRFNWIGLRDFNVVPAAGPGLVLAHFGEVAEARSELSTET